MKSEKQIEEKDPLGMSVTVVFRIRGRIGRARLPPQLPPEMRTALERGTFCVPSDNPIAFPGLLLCDEEGYELWTRRMDRLLGHRSRRIRILAAETAWTASRPLGIPQLLLIFAGIEDAAVLRVLDDGSLLISPAQAQE